MKVWRAPRRLIDAYVAILEGFTFEPGPVPHQYVLMPPGMADGWHWPRAPVDTLAFVPEFTRDWGTGGPIIGREAIYPKEEHGPLLEAGLRLYVMKAYGATLPATPELFIARQAS